MKILDSLVKDDRISAYNVICEMTIREYYELVKDIMDKNDLQRGKVPSSKNIYSLLKEDLIAGCVIPPVVLSMFASFDIEKDKDITNYIHNNKDSLIILDGLQRTFTIEEIYKEYSINNSSNVLERPLRVEFYLGLNREGVLYRMLTLNTGQTRMSLRHQIEMIYNDLLYKDEDYGIKLIRDTDKKAKKDETTFYFSEAVDAFTSFLSGDYLQITRERILDDIESFSKLSKLRDEKDAFKELLITYSIFLKKASCSLNTRLDEIENYATTKRITLFGKDSISIFNKSQPLTGYAAAVYRLLNLKVYDKISSISEGLKKINEDDFFDGTLNVLNYLSQIRDNSRKIGNSQRCFFYYLFKNLLDSDNSETYLSMRNAMKSAKINYERDY